MRCSRCRAEDVAPAAARIIEAITPYCSLWLASSTEEDDRGDESNGPFMATVIAECRLHRGAMLVCSEETDGLSEFLRLSTALANTRHEIDAVVTACDEAYSGFRAWEDQLEKRWSTDPALFDAKTQCEVDRIAESWFALLGRVVKLVDWAATRGQTPTRADSIRHVYAKLLAVERMDYGEMPERMLQATTDAVAACQKGEAGKITAKNF